jgi:hypothetical protein
MAKYPEVHCLNCGSADTLRQRLLGVDEDEEHERAESTPVEADRWRCLRCDYSFTPHPCPECGSYRIEGANGISGQPFEKPLLIVKCWDCRTEFPAHSSVIDGADE